MKKTVISNILILAILLSCTCAPIYAVSGQGRAIVGAHASLLAGDAAGELDLTYYVGSSGSTPSLLGVSQIEVYSINGIRYKTITGSTGNGLLVRGTTTVNDTYTISCQPNTSYYCVVTFYSQDASGTHTSTCTTNTVRSTPEYNK